MREQVSKNTLPPLAMQAFAATCPLARALVLGSSFLSVGHLPPNSVAPEEVHLYGGEEEELAAAVSGAHIQGASQWGNPYAYVKSLMERVVSHRGLQAPSAVPVVLLRIATWWARWTTPTAASARPTTACWWCSEPCTLV